MIASSNKWSLWVRSLVLSISITITGWAWGELERINETDSIEWIVCESTVVATGKISDVKEVPAPEDARYRLDEFTLVVTDTIKGEPKPQVTFRVGRHSKAPAPSKPSGRELLVLLRLHYGQEHLSPTRDRAPFTILDLSDLPETLYDKEIKRVTDRNTLLALCRTWARSDAKHSLHEKVPLESKLYEKLWRGSSVFIKVPAEEKHRLQFLAFAKSTVPDEREAAARMLRKFPGPESEAALRSLLSDSTESVQQGPGDFIFRIEYPIRSAACRSLEELGKPLHGLTLDRAPTAEERQKFWHKGWQQRLSGALQDGWKLTAIRDGETRMVDSRQFYVLVEAEVSNGEEQCTMVLVPKQFETDKAPTGTYLGVFRFGDGGQWLIYARNGIPPAFKDRLAKSYGVSGSTK
ncbi:hypothetical protein AYO49_06460 [Verrucomicrobiaceae bacterium SCGC AG-212-N21]|nr:hypothetical protein AYO49_06460 [Verrucomicrobiaceae bacterium SCGC AG-212-N21]